MKCTNNESDSTIHVRNKRRSMFHGMSHDQMFDLVFRRTYRTGASHFRQRETQTSCKTENAHAELESGVQ